MLVNGRCNDSQAVEIITCSYNMICCDNFFFIDCFYFQPVRVMRS